MTVNYVKAPFPWFGGKSDAADAVWQALGDVPHYVEPFAGSLAVLLRRPHPCNRAYYSETVNDLDGLLCLAPETRVLAADLRWVPIGDVRAGDDLIGFDEGNKGQIGFRAPSRYRHWKTTKAVSTRTVVKDCYRLTFDDGTTVVASKDHLWLAGSHRADAKTGRAWRWIKTSSLVCNRQWQRSWVLKLCSVTQPELSYEAGWLGGFLDGEGNVRKNPGWCVTASQKLGPEADQLASLLLARGFQIERSTIGRHAKNERHQDIENFVIRGGMRETLRLLMLVRPERLIRNMISAIDNSSLYGREHQAVGLVGKDFLGATEVVALETDTHTYVAEGLASHNCNAWRSIQHSPDATADAASWPVSEADLTARHLAIVKWQAERDVEHLCGDPAWHDPVIAGWWLWGISCWIGGGWCTGDGPWVATSDGRLVRGPGGVSKRLPHLTNNGQGVNHAGLREPGVGDPEFHPTTMPELRRWFAWLSARLRHVRILCGDWRRAVTSGAAKTLPVRQGQVPAGIFLDPPYSAEANRGGGLYTKEDLSVAHDVRAWCLEHGVDKDLRIVLAGYAGEHDDLEAHGWRVVEWFRAGFLKGGMGQRGKDGHQQGRERLWLSPHCLQERQGDLFRDGTYRSP